MMDQALKYWQSRPARDRLVLGIGGGITLLFFLYTSLWQPLEESRGKLRHQLPALREAASEMTGLAREAAALKAKPAVASAQGTPEKNIAAAALEVGLKADQYHLTTAPNSRIAITVAKVNFDAWLKWLRVMQVKDHWRLQDGTIEPAGRGGLVKVTGTLAPMDMPR